MLLIPEKHQTALRHNNLSKFQGNANLFYTKQRSNISWREFYDFTERPQGITDIARRIQDLFSFAMRENIKEKPPHVSDDKYGYLDCIKSTLLQHIKPLDN